MTLLKCSAAALALFLASSMAYAEESTGAASSGTGTTAQSGSSTSGTTGATKSDGSSTMSTDSGSTAQTGGTTGTSTDSSTASGTTGSTTGTTTTTTEIPKTGTDSSASSSTSTTGDTSASGTASTTGDAATTTSMTQSSGTMSNAMLASQFMGQTVYSTANESVGEINDLVLNKELDTVTAIIGVGGFLGIGEKDVAIPVDQLTAAKDENNNIRLTIAASKEELEAAPAFDRTALN